MLPFHVQIFYQYPQDLLDRAPLSPLVTQSVLILVVAPSQVQDLALHHELHEVHVCPLLKLVTVPLDGIPSLNTLNSSVLSADLLRMHSIAMSVSLIKMLSSTGLNTHP